MTPARAGRRCRPRPPRPGRPTGWTTVVRLLGLLPGHWSCHSEVGQDRVVLRVELAGATDAPAVRRAVSCVLADTALRGWTEEF
ncbi:hypothetical protein GTX14_08155 [Streptomyces sp. SID4944]|nr:hypothetical protein [Streptomyces sp. SID4944]